MVPALFMRGARGLLQELHQALPGDSSLVLCFLAPESLCFPVRLAHTQVSAPLRHLCIPRAVTVPVAKRAVSKHGADARISSLLRDEVHSVEQEVWHKLFSSKCFDK